MTAASQPSLREQAVVIWKAGVEAVDSERLVGNVIARRGDVLTMCGHDVSVNRLGRLAVVGAGKAGAGMAAALEHTVGDDILRDKLTGWVNVPADCVRPLKRVHLHAARPAGVNEPCAEGVEGSRRILDIVQSLGPEDVCLVLLSGGGSALLPAPVDEVGLPNKQWVTRFLMGAGASIQELNCVRKQLSRLKGGGLARACRAGLTMALIISDVIGDPLETIASGPTVPDSQTPQDALQILWKYAQSEEDVPDAVWEFLQQKARRDVVSQPFPETVHNHVIGNNAVALAAAGDKASRLGFHVASLGSENAGEARVLGEALAERALTVRDEGQPLGAPACLLSGGEPVVHLAHTDQPRKGGRNQEVVLAGLQRLWNDGMPGIVLLSGGTDGEDGPTDAAGAVADAVLLKTAESLNLRPEAFLAINNSYPFFEQTGGLLKTGPTHTNVMDLQVILVTRE